MDYSVSKLSLIYFSTFSGNRFNSDYIEFAILELVVAGCFRKQLSQEMPFGTLEEMPHSFSCFNQRPHTSASLLHSHFDPCGSAPSVKTKQTACPQRPLYNAQLFSPSSPCERMAAAREEAMCWSTGCQPASDSPPLPNSTSLGRSGTGCPMSLPSCLLILPSPYKIPSGWTLLPEKASITGQVTGTGSSRGKAHVTHPAQRRGIFSMVSVWVEPR